MNTQTPHLIRLLRNGSQTGQRLCERMDVSRATLSRLMEDCQSEHPGFLCQIGAARSTRYAWAKPDENHPDQPWNIPVYHVDRHGVLQSDGTLTVLEADEYLFTPSNALRSRDTNRYPGGWMRPHYEGIPWFLQDIRPQGYLGRALAQQLFRQPEVISTPLPEHIHQWNDDQVLWVITQMGNDLPGHFLIGAASAERFITQSHATDAIHAEDRANAYAQNVRNLMGGRWIPHSSAGGEQPKFVAHVTDRHAQSRHVIVKFSPPAQDASPVAQRWCDLLIAEHHALSVLAEHDMPAAHTELLQGSDGRWFLESTRFDREGAHGRVPVFSLRSVLLEATGDLPGWVPAAAILHRDRLIHMDTMARIHLLDAYGHFIGNTDRHPGNLSFTQPDISDSAHFSLAPAYDMLPMQYAPEAQGSMLPDFRPITPYPVQHEMVPIAQDLAAMFWSGVARDPRISKNFREMAITHAEDLMAIRQKEVLPQLPEHEASSALSGSGLIPDATTRDGPATEQRIIPKCKQ
ncbi:type II toxin-antitoxin system HipA family toxin YjjJ [Acidithiobacillus ferrivorans]|nr:type II toxin-antitoxin system HipA family toxin YjjJ [Acidithiobacillus ferrivorans]